MRAFRFAAILGLIFACAVDMWTAGPAAASTGVQDPGFSYVDVNNDGLYNPLDGDIGPVDAYIQDGTFDTARSEGTYRAPRYPASLVISRFQQPITAGVPINIRAGVNLI